MLSAIWGRDSLGRGNDFPLLIVLTAIPERVRVVTAWPCHFLADSCLGTAGDEFLIRVRLLSAVPALLLSRPD